MAYILVHSLGAVLNTMTLKSSDLNSSFLTLNNSLVYYSIPELNPYHYTKSKLSICFGLDLVQEQTAERAATAWCEA